MKKNEMIVFWAAILSVSIYCAVKFPKWLKKVKWEDDFEADQAVQWTKDYLATTEPFENN